MTKEESARLTEKSDDKLNGSKSKVELVTLVNWDDLPEWQQDNHYIRTAYRPTSGSYHFSFLSLGYLHNEAVNIHTHLLGATLFATLALLDLSNPYHTLPLLPFYFGAIACLSMSASFHTISNHSAAVAASANKLDFAGIVALIWGSFASSLYYGLSCHPKLRALYMVMITAIGAGCLITSTKDRFRTPAWRTWRSGMFVAMGLSAVFPVLHGLKLHGWARLDDGIALKWLVSQGALYILGAGLYAGRWPECMKPGRFDVWGSSHQIFHVLVVVAAWTHLSGLEKARLFHETVPESLRCQVMD